MMKANDFLDDGSMSITVRIIIGLRCGRFIVCVVFILNSIILAQKIKEFLQILNDQNSSRRILGLATGLLHTDRQKHVCLDIMLC